MPPTPTFLGPDCVAGDGMHVLPGRIRIWFKPFGSIAAPSRVPGRIAAAGPLFGALMRYRYLLQAPVAVPLPKAAVPLDGFGKWERLGRLALASRFFLIRPAAGTLGFVLANVAACSEWQRP